MRRYITVFELIRKNASRERQIDDIIDSGKYDIRALFQERCRKKLQITISVKRLKEEFRIQSGFFKVA